MSSATGAQVPKEEGNERAGNLRTTFTERFIQPVGPHTGLNLESQQGDCKWADAPPDSDIWYTMYQNCFPQIICEQPEDRTAVLLRA